MTSSIRIDKGMPMEMRNGVLLRGDIYRPNDRQKHLAILMRTPYNQAVTLDFSFLSLIDTVTYGYAFIIQSLRGTFNSEGATGLDDVSFTVYQPLFT